MWRMTWDELLAYCLAKPGAWQDEPWEGDVVAKVGQKIFAFLGAGIAGRDGPSVGLKCAASREAADEWLLRFPADASAMRYIGRSGWNTLAVGGGIPDDEIREAVDASYAMVVTKLPKRDRPVSLPPPAPGRTSAGPPAKDVGYLRPLWGLKVSHVFSVDPVRARDRRSRTDNSKKSSSDGVQFGDRRRVK